MLIFTMCFDTMERDRPGSCDPRATLTTTTFLARRHVMADSQSSIPSTVYKDIPEFPGYRISTDCSVWSCRGHWGGFAPGEWHQLVPVKGATGYLQVKLCRDGMAYVKKLHVLMLEVFVGPRPPGMVARHYPDRNPGNCSLGNLVWGTPRENSADRRSHGTEAAGSKNGNAKLTETDVAEIRLKFAIQVNKRDKQTLSREYGVTTNMIRYILEGRYWADS